MISIDNKNYFRYHKKSYHVEPLKVTIEDAAKYILTGLKDKTYSFSPATWLTKFLGYILGAEYSTIPKKDLENLIKGVKKALPKDVVKRWDVSDKNNFEVLKKAKSVEIACKVVKLDSDGNYVPVLEKKAKKAMSKVEKNSILKGVLKDFLKSNDGGLKLASRNPKKYLETISVPGIAVYKPTTKNLKRLKQGLALGKLSLKQKEPIVL